MRKGIIFLPILVIVLAVAVFGTVGYFAWQNTRSSVTTTNTRNNDTVLANSNTSVNADDTPINSNSSTQDETKDWKTYSNSKYGFSFKYPSEYKNLETSDLEERQKELLNKEGYPNPVGPVIAKLSMGAEPIIQNSYPSLTMNVFDLDDYRFDDRPGGVLYGYDRATHAFWKNEADVTRASANLKRVAVQGIEGFLTGTGDGPAERKVIIFVNESHDLAVDLGFGTMCIDTGKEALECTKNLDIWKEVAATFTFTK